MVSAIGAGANPVDMNTDEKYIEQWKIKRLKKKLDEARG